MKTTRKQRLAIKKENKNWPKELVTVSKSMWPMMQHGDKRLEVLRSRYFLVQKFAETEGIRLSINRTEMDKSGWKENVTWEELQAIKKQCGYGNRLAVEIYPADKDVVNVANMRHLWILDDYINAGWVK